MDATSSSLATAETNVRERDVTMKIFPMSHTTVPSAATGHSLKPSDHADPDVMVLSVPASAITDEEEERKGDLRGAAHTFKPTTLVQSVTSLCLPTLYLSIEQYTQFSPSLTQSFTLLVVVHNVLDFTPGISYFKKIRSSQINL